MKINVKVHANSSREKVRRISEEEYEVWVKAKPIEGKANESIEKLIKKKRGFKKVRIVSGFSSKVKKIEVD